MNLQEIVDREKKQSFSEGIEAGREQGLSQGMAQEKLKNAKSMKTAGIDLSIINTVTGLSLAEIQEL